jgi:hemolysin activation/secretion protein
MVLSVAALVLLCGTSVGLGQSVTGGTPGSRPETGLPGKPATPAPDPENLPKQDGPKQDGPKKDGEPGKDGEPDFAEAQPNRGQETGKTPAELEAMLAESGDPEAPSYLVSAFVIRYAVDHPSLPAIDDLIKTQVVLGRTEKGYVAAGGGVEAVSTTVEDVALAPPQRWSSLAMLRVAQAVVAELNARGVVGVTVAPVESEFAPGEPGDPEWGKDLRKPGQSAVTLLVRTGFVTEMRTLAFGQRIDPSLRVNAPQHEWILANSPVQIARPDDAERRDILRKDQLDDYVFRLNRHPGRRVDLAIAAGQDPGGIALDFLVNENKPWLAYFQVSNTGTRQTDEWRQRFGFQHNQLTGHDDILSIDYVTAGFKDTHSILASYDTPIAGDWLRLKVFGSFSTYQASDVGFVGQDFEGDSTTVGGELAANVFQRRELFVDAFAGLRYQDISVENKLINTDGSDEFLIPTLGLRLERITELSATTASIGVDFNIDAIGTSVEDSELLGRLDPDTDFVTLQWDMNHSFYLDTFFTGGDLTRAGAGELPTLAHEIALGFRGQYAFDNRLIPNFEQVLGGLYTVRGYPESVAAGDSVVLGTAEYRFHLPQALGYDPTPGTLFGDTFRYKPQQPYARADWDLILKGFVDAGRTFNSDATSFEEDRTLVGAGVGIEFLFKQNLTIRIDSGWALKEIPGEVKAGANRIHFVATLLF